jgi:transposase
MSIEQRANIKFCFKLGKYFTETHQMMKQVYGNDCLSRSTIYEWFNRFKGGREDLNDDERSGRPREAVNEENIKKCVNSSKLSQNLQCDTWKWN